MVNNGYAHLLISFQTNLHFYSHKINNYDCLTALEESQLYGQDGNILN